MLFLIIIVNDAEWGPHPEFKTQVKTFHTGEVFSHT